MKYIVIVGHGNYATGLESSLNMLSGVDKELIAIDFLESETDIDLGNKIKEIFNMQDEFLFVTDLMGGTPFKECSKLAMNNDKVRVVTGTNIGALIEAKLMKNSKTLEELANSIIESTKKHAMYVEIKPVVEEEVTDGI